MVAYYAKNEEDGDDVIELTPREHALLTFMAVHAGEVITRTMIWEHLYEFNSDAQSNVVEVYIGRLRRKIEKPKLRKKYGGAEESFNVVA